MPFARHLTSRDVDRLLAGCAAHDAGTPYDPQADEMWRAGWLTRSTTAAERGRAAAPFVNPARPPSVASAPPADTNTTTTTHATAAAMHRIGLHRAEAGVLAGSVH